jgi:pyruvate formate lyase activating enzyme
MRRRDFLKRSVQGTSLLAASGYLCPLSELLAEDRASPGASFLSLPEGAEFEGVEARHYKKLEEMKVECGICPKKCRVADLERGYCGVRENRKGVYYTLVYGKICSAHVDPIEKKPLFHYLPSTRAYSIATAGCNFECRFCQNWQIAQFRPEQVRNYDLPPSRIAGLARQYNCPTIAYTYTEPVIFWEYMHDCARKAREQGVGSVAITNGFIEMKPLVELCSQLTGIKIDLKSFSESFYRDYCSGELKPVLDTLVKLKELGMWTELVVLVIPTLNDSSEEIKKMCAWINKNLGPDVPVHFTRFHPTYKIRNLPRTPVSTLERAYKIAKSEGLHFPYVGNVPGHNYESTYCPGCGEKLIDRTGYVVTEIKIKSGSCPVCKKTVPGVWTKKDVKWL